MLETGDIHGNVVYGALGLIECPSHSVSLDVVEAVELLARAPNVQAIPQDDLLLPRSSLEVGDGHRRAEIVVIFDVPTTIDANRRMSVSRTILPHCSDVVVAEILH